MTEPHPIPMNIEAHINTLTNANIQYSEEDFLFQFDSGNQVRRFMASPKHAKRILLLLQARIGEYEKQFGDIKTELIAKQQQSTEEKKFGF